RKRMSTLTRNRSPREPRGEEGAEGSAAMRGVSTAGATADARRDDSETRRQRHPWRPPFGVRWLPPLWMLLDYFGVRCFRTALDVGTPPAAPQRGKDEAPGRG